jgi:hypothetical protein
MQNLFHRDSNSDSLDLISRKNTKDVWTGYRIGLIWKFQQPLYNLKTLKLS